MPGKIILVGGHEDKQGRKEILTEFHKYSDSDSIGIVTAASSVPEDVFADYQSAFENLTKNLTHFDIRGKSDCKQYTPILEDVSALFFTGGDQQNLHDIFIESEFLTVMKKKWMAGMLLGGTSAGASIWGRKMIVQSEEENHEVKDIDMLDGFGLLDNFIIDQHFSQRERFRRMIYEVGMTQGIGIGIDENTAVVYGENHLRTIGENMVTVMDGRNVVYKGGQNTITDIRLHLVGNGNQFSLG